MIGPGGTVHLDSLDFSAPIAAFYRTTTLAQG